MAAVIALVAGVFASSLRKEAEHATDRTLEAEEAAHRAEEAARREAEARRDLSAFHTAILAGVASEDPAQGIQEIAEAVRTGDGVRLPRGAAARDRRGGRGGVGRRGRVRRPRLPPRYPFHRGERAVRVGTGARAAEPASGPGRGGRAPAGRRGRHRHPARARQRTRIHRPGAPPAGRTPRRPGLTRSCRPRGCAPARRRCSSA